MTTRSEPVPAPDKNDKATSNNERWDADEEAWRHPPVTPVDESAAESLGRSISDVVIGSTDTEKEKARPKHKPKP
jgi:hypothetical protein